MCGRPTGSSCSVPVLSPVGTHSYQQSHCCPPHTNQAVPYLSSAQSVPTVTNSHTAALHTHIKPFRIFPPPSPYPHLQRVTLLPFTPNQGVPNLSSAQSVPTVTNSHTVPLHTQIKPFPIFPPPSLYPHLPRVKLLPFTLNQGVPYLSSAQSVPTVTNSHTAALHTQIKPLSIFPQPSRYTQLPTVTLLPSTHTSSR